MNRQLIIPLIFFTLRLKLTPHYHYTPEPQISRISTDQMLPLLLLHRYRVYKEHISVGQRASPASAIIAGQCLYRRHLAPIMQCLYCRRLATDAEQSR